MGFFKKLRCWKRAGNRRTGVRRGLLKCLLPCIWQKSRSPSVESIRSTHENPQETTHVRTGEQYEALIQAERQQELLYIQKMTRQETRTNESRHSTQDDGISFGETEEGHRREERGVCLEDFNEVGFLGEGRFGSVILAEKKSTDGLSSSKELFAIKVVPNRYVFEAEKEVFIRAVGHPFLVQLHTYFRTEESFYYVMEYSEERTLHSYIVQHCELFEDSARLYAAQIILAVNFLHDCGIVHRDINPRNILLDGCRTHCKLADFGLAQLGVFKGMHMTRMCGIPGYTAPEMFQGRPYGPEVDWYSVGCVMSDMLLGGLGFEDPLDPSDITPDAVSIIMMLKQNDPELRLGARGDTRSILMHPFFKGVKWGAVLQKRANLCHPWTWKVWPVVRGSSGDVDETGNDGSFETANDDSFETAKKGPAHTTCCLLHLLGGPFLWNRSLLLFRSGIPVPQLY